MSGSRDGASLTMLVGYRAEVVRRPYPTFVGGPRFTERTSAGLDVHARSVPARGGRWRDRRAFHTKLPPDNDRILEWVRGC